MRQRQQNMTIKYSTLRTVSVPLSIALLLIAGIVTGLLAKDEVAKQAVNFRDMHKLGSVAIIGHFGIPIGQTVTVEGTWEKPSKVSNEKTLHFTKVKANGAVVLADIKEWSTKWPSQI